MGLRSFVSETLRYVRLAGLGGKTSVAAIVAKDLQPDITQNEKQNVMKTLRAGGQIQQVFAFLGFSATVIIAMELDSFSQGLSLENVAMAKWCTIIFGLSFSLYLASGVYSGILTGKQLVGQTSLYNSIATVIGTCVGVLLVYIGWSLYGVAMASLVAAVIVFIQYRWRTAKLGIRLRLFRRPLEKDAMPRLLKLGGWILIAAVGALLGYNSSRIVLGITPGLGMTAVNQFALLATVPIFLREQANRISVILRPGLTQLYYSGADTTKIHKLAFLLLRLTGTLGATAFVGIWLINGAFVVRWVGAEYYAGDLANLLFAILTALTIWTFGFKVLLEVRFEYRRRGLAFLATGLTSVVLALVLVRRFGLSGALIAGILAEMLIIVPLVVSRVLSWLFHGQSGIGVFVRISWLPCLLILLGIGLRWKVSYRPSSWPEVIVSALLIGTVYLFVGGIWLWPDLRHYGVFRKLNARFSKVTFAES
jgi:O-antigen/teichoic acid export membrane protein